MTSFGQFKKYIKFQEKRGFNLFVTVSEKNGSNVYATLRYMGRGEGVKMLKKSITYFLNRHIFTVNNIMNLMQKIFLVLTEYNVHSKIDKLIM